ncbi:MAG TPA: head-tail adaptor protein [Paracoccaceae bacterium]|nr:head-tail adaptor protein [Paracoccaceae bacterium]HMO71673.1 head-tail adaptor protein [Paracoccaceae bacterium]
MRAPRLHRFLELEAEMTTPDGAGGYVRSWVGMGMLPAEVRPGTGREAAGQEVPLSSQGFRIRVRGAPQGAPSRPLAGQRFRDGQRRFAILAVTEDDPDGRYLVCTAREEDPA